MSNGPSSAQFKYLSEILAHALTRLSNREISSRSNDQFMTDESQGKQTNETLIYIYLDEWPSVGKLSQLDKGKRISFASIIILQLTEGLWSPWETFSSFNLFE